MSGDLAATDSQQSTSPVLEKAPERKDLFPHGWRLVFTAIGIYMSLYLVNLEVTIVSTSLITITSDLNGFDKTSWIITGFLSTYTGFMSIWTKISNIIGRKKTLIAANVMFLAFSLGCGLSKSINTLIICRSFQGIGGAGVYPLVILCAYEIAPKPQLPIYGAFTGLSIACAAFTGPIFGGVLAQHHEWQWVFYINLIPGAIAVLMLVIAMPKEYGTVPSKPITHLKPNLPLFRHLDIVGAVWLLAGVLLLITVLNEANIQFDWSSGTAIGLLVLSAVSWIIFFAWEWWIDGYPDYEPIFPVRFLFNRAWMGMLITTFVSGCPWNVVVVYLAQRFQVLEKMSPLSAGIHLIPYTALATVSTTIASIACLRGRIPFVYIILFASILHTVGIALLSTLPESGPFPDAGYGYEVLAGSGVGVTIGILVLAVPYVVETRDLATASGAINQCRFLGGAIGLAIASNIQTGDLKTQLSSTMSQDQLHLLLQNTGVLETLPAQLKAQVLHVFAQGYTKQFQAMIAFAAVQIPSCLLMLRRGSQYVAKDDDAEIPTQDKTVDL
ncbi:MFS multidrug transporter [Aspergillus avenaceus]|uniref:MFS multidrug transporter n=1 Tax=Aspergillus avenaceus TaxID=36643 RepID=A0A5N6UAB2_ASPAV|nr:MFS multidrug transporter [Aspergillus avenaceus]